MKKEEMYKVVTAVDEELLQEAEVVLNNGRNRSWKPWILTGAAAACVAVVLVGVLHKKDADTMTQGPIIYGGAEVGPTTEEMMDGDYNILEEGVVEDVADEDAVYSSESYAVEIPEDGSGAYVETIDTSKITEESADFYGGCYLDDQGVFCIVVVGNTPEHRKYISYELGIHEDAVKWVEGLYSHAYLTKLHEKITEGMVSKEFPFISTCGVYDMENRVIVEVLASYEGSLDALMDLDTLGGALEIHSVKDDAIVAE